MLMDLDTSRVVSNLVKWGNSLFWFIIDTWVFLFMRLFKIYFSHHAFLLDHHPMTKGWSIHLESPYFKELKGCMDSSDNLRVLPKL